MFKLNLDGTYTFDCGKNEFELVYQDRCIKVTGQLYLEKSYISNISSIKDYTVTLWWGDNFERHLGTNIKSIVIDLNKQLTVQIKQLYALGGKKARECEEEFNRICNLE